MAHVDNLGVDADFERTPAYVYAESEDDVDDLRDEAAAAQRVGLPATVTESPDAPFEVAGALRFDDQAQFTPGSTSWRSPRPSTTGAATCSRRRGRWTLRPGPPARSRPTEGP